MNDNKLIKLSAMEEYDHAIKIPNTIVYRGVIHSVEHFTINEKDTLCAVVINDDVKVVIPLEDAAVYEYPSLKAKSEGREKQIMREAVLTNMIGARIPYVVNTIIRDQNIVLASRKAGLDELKRKNKHKVNDKIVVNVIGTTPNYIVCEFDGYVSTMGRKEYGYGSYTNLAKEISVGATRQAKIIGGNEDEGFEISFKQVEDSPFKKYVVDRKYYVNGGVYAGVIKTVDDNRIYISLGNDLIVAASYPYGNKTFNKQIGDNCIVKITKVDEKKEHLYGSFQQQ